MDIFCDQRFLTIMLLSYILHWKAIIMETFLSTPPDLMSPGLERHHYHVCPSWWHHPLSKQYHRTDDNTHNDDITTNNYITLAHGNKPHRRLSLTVLLPQMHMLPIMQGEHWTKLNCVTCKPDQAQYLSFCCWLLSSMIIASVLSTLPDRRLPDHSLVNNPCWSVITVLTTS